MNTYTRTIPAAELPRFRRSVIRHGGAIVRSVFCQAGFYVTYVGQAGL